MAKNLKISDNEKDVRLIIEEDNNLVRDKKTNAILNTDKSALERYRTRREKEREMLQKVEKVEKLEQEMKEMKMLMRNFINTIEERE